MSILEIITLGYAVNVVAIIMVFLLIIIQSFTKMSFLNHVDKMKVITYQQSIWNKYLSAKERMKTFKLNFLESRDFSFLFPFAYILEFLVVFWHFLKFDLDVFIFERIKSKTQRMEDKITKYSDNEEKNDINNRL